MVKVNDQVVLKSHKPQFDLEAGRIGRLSNIQQIEETETTKRGVEYTVEFRGKEMGITVTPDEVYSMDVFRELYEVLGFELDLAGFCMSMAAHERSLALWQRVAARLAFVDALRHNINMSYDPAIHGLYYGAFVDRQLRPLEMYLLCTCFDVIANHRMGERPLSYDDWLQVKTRKVDADRRDKLVADLCTEFDGQSLSRDNAVNISKKMYAFYQKEYGGLGRNFHNLFQSLPQSIQTYLANVYLISNRGDIPLLNEEIAEIEEEWSQKPHSSQLQLISGYLWQHRRNKYTHEAETPSGLSGWYLYWNDSEPPELVMQVLCKQHELWLLRNLIVLMCHIELEYDHDSDFLVRLYRYRTRIDTLNRTLKALRHNQELLNSYIPFLESLQLGDMKRTEDIAIFHNCPLPQFEVKTCEHVLESNLLNSRLSLVEQGFINWLPNYISALTHLNELIEHWDNQNPSGSNFEDRRLSAISFLSDLKESTEYRQYVESRETARIIGNIPPVMIKYLPADASWID